MKKIIILGLFTLVLSLTTSIPLQATSYNYTPFLDVIYSAQAMTVSRVVDSSNLVNTAQQRVSFSFGDLVDLVVFQDHVYIVDQSNHAVHVLNRDYQWVHSIMASSGEAKLTQPRAVFVTQDFIYIADWGNQRIAIFNHDYTYQTSITAPNDPTFKQSPSDTQGYDFRPLKLTVDRTGRVYVIADQIFEGILDFNPDGSFSRYVGANTITLSLWDAFWLRFTSEEQRAAQGYRLATTFINLKVDSQGYLYTVSSISEGSRVIKKLNFKGIDVLNRNGYIPQIGDPIGALSNRNVPSGQSQLVDIDVNEFGNYMVLDRVRGRIFTYDFDGNLLYVAGQLANIGGNQHNLSNAFLNPTALTYFQDKVLVIDQMNKNLIEFSYTEFGRLVNQATEQYYLGHYETAKDLWEEVLVLNTNYFLAYAGIAKAQLRSGEYELAMQNAKLGYDDITFSRSYQPHRYQQLVVVFPYLIGISLFALVYAFGRTIFQSVKKAKEEENVG